MKYNKAGSMPPLKASTSNSVLTSEFMMKL